MLGLRLTICVTADVRRVGAGRGLCGGQEKEWMGCFLDDLTQSFRHHQRRPVDDCSPGRGGMEQNGGTSGGAFHGEMVAAEKAKARLRRAVVCPNMTGRTKQRTAQSKRARAGSFALPC